ncbi:hypothetical protein SAMN04489844_0876 [Nocardioides exalbidus]|uniref:Uncharacterized protein n=1 Tax=Nocardioides exalbidus TaxID=402596 RepID=A0A1H4LHA3_9ACTN|nr:hypothetical protein [Nocardioides exalbidus]SEB70067.1 hypothetical protein SAMN04489844_0876 [Nocardioides exalbidus]
MNSKPARLVLASIALVSLAGLAAPASAAPVGPTTLKTGWCC